MRSTDPSDDSPSPTPVLPAAEPGTRTFHVADNAPAPPTVTGTSDDLTRDDRPEVYPLGRFGKYELLEAFPGGMGIVYMARDTTLGRVVALKKLFPDQRARPNELKRFLREVRAVAQLRHPHIIPIHEFAEIDGAPYFTTDFIATGNLSHHRARFYRDTRATVILMEKVARAVHHAHIQSIIHRDLKPGNVLLTATDEPLVSDFGLAKMLDADAEITATGTILGTPAYMSPEQARGVTHALNARTDIWSLGVILYELLTGARPFLGSTRAEVTPRILHDQPTPPHKRQPALDGRLDVVVLKCLQKEPADRYPTAEALADDLKRWLDDQPIEARLPQPPLPAPPRRVSRRTVLWAGLGATAAIVGAGVGAARFFAPADEEPTEQKVARERIERALLSYRTVPLLRPTGEPEWQRWIMGPVTPATSANGILTIDTDSLTLLELLPDPNLSWYEFTADVRHNSGGGGAVGIYVGRTVVPKLPGVHWFFSFQFCDHDSPEAGKNPDPAVRFVSVRLNRTDGKTSQDGKGTTLKIQCRRNREAGDEWRKLALVVERTSLGAKLNDVPGGFLAPQEMEEWARHLDHAPGTNPTDRYPTPTPFAGVGLFIQKSSASFKNVTIGRPPEPA